MGALSPLKSNSAEERVKDHVSKATSFCMIKQIAPIVTTTESCSSGSAMDSRGDYPLSQRGSSNNLTKNRFSFQQFG